MMNSSQRTRQRCLTVIVVAAAMGCMTSVSPASIQLAGWEMSGISNFGPSPFAATTGHPDVTVGGLTRGSGVTTIPFAGQNAWGGNGWNVANFDAAIAANKYVTFSISANPGIELSLCSIASYNVRRSPTGPTTGQWQYSLDGNSFTNIGSSITWGGVTNSAGNPQLSIDLSSVPALQNLIDAITVTFRVVNWGASDPAGTWYFNQFQTGSDLIVMGTVAQQQQPVIPEASALLVWLLLGGTVVLGSTRRGERH